MLSTVTKCVNIKLAKTKGMPIFLEHCKINQICLSRFNIWMCKYECVNIERVFSLAGAGLKFNADEMDPKQAEYVRCSRVSPHFNAYLSVLTYQVL